jgi:hypothetical protein
VIVRTEERNGDLRVGYYCHLLLSKSAVLKAIGLGIPLGIVAIIFFLHLQDVLSSAEKPMPFLFFATICVMISLPLILLVILKAQRTDKEIRRWLIETADSMGAKQLTPFKVTTVKLED